MSRHSFKALVQIHEDGRESILSAYEYVQIVVGWDVPFQTFFGDVEITHNPVFGLSNHPKVTSTMIDLGRFDIYNVDVLEKLIGYHIPDKIKNQLLNDRDTGGNPSRLQSMMASIFNPNNLKG